ncbi:MAG TPA: MFS transporter [Candidatus Paceibacterota bacterium]|nr:MFS transporter [Candidatus Paceibacterota bacterium]
MHPRIVLAVGNFFFSLFATLTIYILLPYLSTFMPSAATGLVVAGGALVACIAFPFLPRLVARYGAQQLALVIALAEMITLFALAASPGAVAAAVLVALTVALQPFLAYELDLLLEATVAEEGTTGRVRTLFLTAWNVAALAAPLLIGALLANSDAYGRIFLAAAAALVPFTVLFAARRLPKGEVPRLSAMGDTLLCIVQDRDLAAVSFGHLLLYLFYVWAPLYAPVFLHDVIGVSWVNLGWMFSIMLVPFVLIEYPAGYIADRWLGDKELMFAGYLLAGVALASLGFLTRGTPLVAILIILVVSRAGAAFVESMTEGHFFRRVSEKDINTVSVFRGIWPLADLIAPLVGSVILFVGNFHLLFFFTGSFIALAGIASTLFIKDFR